MTNEWGNPDAKYVILGADPTAFNSDPKGRMKYPFGLPDRNSIRSGEKCIRTRYFYRVYDNILTVLEDNAISGEDASEYVADNFLIINAIGTQVRDEHGILLETSKSVRKKEKAVNLWLKTFLYGEENGVTHKSLLAQRIRNKAIFLTSSYLLNIFSCEPWFHGFRDIEKKCKQAYITGKLPDELKKNGNAYEADFYPFYRHRKYRLSDDEWKRYRMVLKEVMRY